MAMKKNANDEAEKLRRNIADIKNRMPAHSIKPKMFQELEELEEKLSELLRRKDETE